MAELNHLELQQKKNMETVVFLKQIFIKKFMVIQIILKSLKSFLKEFITV